jgi:hypothetical protein
MNTLDHPRAAEATVVAVPHVIKGETRFGDACRHSSGGLAFTTPAVDLDPLIWPRSEPGPAFDTPVDEIVELLVATGEAVRQDSDGLLAEALDAMRVASPLDDGVLARCYEDLAELFMGDILRAQLQNELGGSDVLDGWRPVTTPWGAAKVRAFPPRLVHVLAGNAPGVAAQSITRGALVKGVNLLKLPSNDLFTATAILRVMAKVASDHPVTRSFSAVYWRGGDEKIEGSLFQPQYFDKLVAWGGESAIRSAKRYIGPGFELVSFDPKTSISFIGREAFADQQTLAEVARRAGTDATPFNQSACVSSRIQYVEGTPDQIDEYCRLLQVELGVERRTCSVVGPHVPASLREEIEMLRAMEPIYGVWGKYDGRGIVIRSEEQVDFHPDGKIVNVVPVANLADAVRFANVATQTVGVYPPERKEELRDTLASAGVQRVVSLGSALGPAPGLPHDGFCPLHRFVRWVTDEGPDAAAIAESAR